MTNAPKKHYNVHKSISIALSLIYQHSAFILHLLYFVRRVFSQLINILHSLHVMFMCPKSLVLEFLKPKGQFLHK